MPSKKVSSLEGKDSEWSAEVEVVADSVSELTGGLICSA